jgi:hypothetical protein
MQNGDDSRNLFSVDPPSSGRGLRDPALARLGLSACLSPCSRPEVGGTPVGFPVDSRRYPLDPYRASGCHRGFWLPGTPCPKKKAGSATGTEPVCEFTAWSALVCATSLWRMERKSARFHTGCVLLGQMDSQVSAAGVFIRQDGGPIHGRSFVTSFTRRAPVRETHAPRSR